MSIIERGKLIRNCASPKSLAYFSANESLVADLYRQFRIEWVCGRDRKPLNIEDKEWVVVGSKGRIWEYGGGMLGISVEGSKWVPAFLHLTQSYATVTQGGDGEMNLKCPWTAENVKRLAKILKLHKSPKLRSEAQRAVMRANLKVLNAPPEAVGGTQDGKVGTK